MVYKFNFIEKMLLSKDIIPHPFADASVNAGLAKNLGVAVKLGITDQLSAEPQRIASIAQKTGLSKKGVELSLNGLEALGYVSKSDSGYALNKRGLKTLDKNSPHNFRYFILFAEWLYDSYTSLEQTIKKGHNQHMDVSQMSEHQWELFSRAMIDIARITEPEVSKKIKLPAGVKRLTDLGGGHGLYSIGLCKKYDGLSATILDYEPVRKYTEECIERHRMGGRVSFKACDFMKEAIPTGNDVVLAFNIIHGLEKDENLSLFKKVYDALEPGGQLIILDQIKGIGGKSQMARAMTAYMALNLFHQVNGNTYSFDEVQGWALQTGFSGAKMKKLNSPGFGLIFCQK